MADPDSTTGKSPAFQFYPNDFLSDANVIGMSLQERGAYITLLCICWQQGTLPADVGRLARLCGSPLVAFRRLWPALEPCFRVDSEHTERLIHPRLERERDKQADFRRRQSDNGRHGGRPRKPTTNPNESQTKGLGFSGITQTEAKKSSSSSSSSSSSDFSQKKEPPPDARSKQPVHKGQRLTVFAWQLADLCGLLGPHTEAFGLDEWFYELDARLVKDGIVAPSKDGGEWLKAETLKEAQRRGLPLKLATAEPEPYKPNLENVLRIANEIGGRRAR